MFVNRRSFEDFCISRLPKVLGKYTVSRVVSNNSTSQGLANHGFWEAWNSVAIFNKVIEKLNPRCVDIGANVGYYSMLFHLAGARNIAVYEPNKDLVKVLTYIDEVNNLGLKIYDCAVGGSQGYREFVVTEQDLGGSYIKPASGSKTNLVRCEDIRNVIDLHQPDVIKIDVEGAEDEILRTMLSEKYFHKMDVFVEIFQGRNYNFTELIHFLFMRADKVGVCDFDGSILICESEDMFYRVFSNEKLVYLEI